MLTSFNRIIKTAITSLWRNRGLSAVSTVIMVITLLIISIFLSINIVTNKMTKSLESRIDMVAYLKDEASEEQITGIKKMLSARSDVLEVEYVSKQEALLRWQERYRDNDKIRDAVSAENNPLPRSIEIKTKKTDDLEEVARVLEDRNYSSVIRELSYSKNRDTINRLIRITNFIKIAGWSLSSIFIIISILVIYNTIRLTIFARSHEIEIMRLVGASDWHVRGPFIAEGIAYGIMATIIAAILILAAFQIIVPQVKDYLGEFDLGGGYLGINFALVILVQLLVGVVLGFSCSYSAIKRYLR